MSPGKTDSSECCNMYVPYFCNVSSPIVHCAGQLEAGMQGRTFEKYEDMDNKSPVCRSPGQHRQPLVTGVRDKYAREVFRSRPKRRFIPGYTICRGLMRL